MVKNKKALEQFFEKINSEQISGNGGPFFAPLLRDENERTALDIALNHRGPKQTDQNDLPLSISLSSAKRNSKSVRRSIFVSKDSLDDSQEKKEDLVKRRSAELLLNHIATYPFGLFNVTLKKQIEIMMNYGICKLPFFFK